jgi:hypothetical protein
LKNSKVHFLSPGIQAGQSSIRPLKTTGMPLDPHKPFFLILTKGERELKKIEEYVLWAKPVYVSHLKVFNADIMHADSLYLSNLICACVDFKHLCFFFRQ